MENQTQKNTFCLVHRMIALRYVTTVHIQNIM